MTQEWEPTAGQIAAALRAWFEMDANEPFRWINQTEADKMFEDMAFALKAAHARGEQDKR